MFDFQKSSLQHLKILKEGNKYEKKYLHGIIYANAMLVKLRNQEIWCKIEYCLIFEEI